MAHDADLTVSLDRSSRIGLPLQIVAGIRAVIATGRLRPGDSLPSSRVLAAQLGVARGTVQTAYEHLIAEGQLVTAARSGTRVNPALQTAPTGGGSPARAPTGRASAARRSGTHAAPVRAAPAQHSTCLLYTSPSPRD